jgi:hypothetical protein
VKKAPSHPYGCGELQHGFALSTHWFDCFCANPSVVSFANSLSHFLLCRCEAWRAFG